ncbi:MAG: 2'-5' RNA ligase family protein [Dehalococcoidia bacterium]
MAPRFTSFDDAWRWFEDGGALVPVAEQREQLLAGRAQFLVFHAHVTDRRVLDIAQDVLDALSDVSGLVPMDPDQLHISIRAVGFQVIEKRRDDEVLRQDVGAIGDRAAKIARRAKAARAEAGPVNVFPEALILEVHDAGSAFATLRRDLAAAVSADAFGIDDAQYLPHITIAWFESAAVADALRERLPEVRAKIEPVETLVRHIQLARWWFTGLDDDAAPELDVVRDYGLRG